MRLDTEQTLCAHAQAHGWRIATRMPGYTRFRKGARTVYVRYTMRGAINRADLSEYQPDIAGEAARVGPADKRKLSTVAGWLAGGEAR